MKYFKILCILICLTSFTTNTYTEDNTTTVATPVTVVTTDVTTPTTQPAAPVVAAETPDAKLSNPWVSLLYDFLVKIMPIVLVLVIIIVKILVKKVEKKYGVDAPEAVEQLAEGLLVKGINWTENWAKTQAAKPTSENKMAETLRFAIEKAANNEVLKAKIEAKGKELVEKLLKEKITPDAATPKE